MQPIRQSLQVLLTAPGTRRVLLAWCLGLAASLTVGIAAGEIWLAVLFTSLMALLGSYTIQSIGARVREGPYTVLDSTFRWRIIDQTGKRAIFTKESAILFNDPVVATIREETWGDAKPPRLDRYHCSAGESITLYKDEARQRYVLVVRLDDIGREGEHRVYRVRREIEDGFLEEEEWVQVAIVVPMHRVTMSVNFPPDRPPVPETVHIETKNFGPPRSEHLGPANTKSLPDGSREVWVEILKPPLGSVYTLRWRW